MNLSNPNKPLRIPNLSILAFSLQSSLKCEINAKDKGLRLRIHPSVYTIHVAIIPARVRADFGIETRIIRYGNQVLCGEEHTQSRKLRWQRCDPRSEEHTSELQSLMRISYAVF